MGFTSKALREKQRIIDEYLSETGKNLFNPGEFLEWLRERPDHACYPVFFGQSDEEAAFEHRKELVRKWVSGLRIVVTESASGGEAQNIKVTERSAPAMFSPMSLRKTGGGYFAFNPDDPEHVDQIAAEAAMALDSWLERYGGIAELKGCKIADIKKTVGKLRTSARVLAAE